MEDKEIDYGDGVWTKGGMGRRMKRQEVEDVGGVILISRGPPLCIHIMTSRHIFRFFNFAPTHFCFDSSLALPHLKPPNNPHDFSSQARKSGNVIS